MWIVYALGSAVSVAVYTTLTKAALSKVEPTVALGVQSVLAMLVAWAVVLYRGQLTDVRQLDAKSWGVSVLSGLLTGVASLLLFLALKAGPASRVAPVDRLSFVFAAVLAYFFLSEKITLAVGAGLGLMTAGAVVILVFGGGSEGG